MPECFALVLCFVFLFSLIIFSECLVVCINQLPSSPSPAHSCKQPRSPANADVAGIDLPAYGYILVYTCQPGYFLSGGSEHRVCRSDGSWTGKVPVCRGSWLAFENLAYDARGDGSLKLNPIKAIIKYKYALVSVRTHADGLIV